MQLNHGQNALRRKLATPDELNFREKKESNRALPEKQLTRLLPSRFCWFLWERSGEAMGRGIQAYRISNTTSTQLLGRHNSEAGRRFLSFCSYSFKRLPDRPGEIKKPLFLSRKQGRGSNHRYFQQCTIDPTFPTRTSFSTVNRKRRPCLSHIR